MLKCTHYKALALRIVLALVLASGLVALRPAHAAAGVNVGILPWKVNAAEEMGFVRDAMLDILSSRIGSSTLPDGETPGIVRADLIKGELGKGAKGESAAVAAARVGKALRLDYVLYGSLTILGDSLSLDARLLDVTKGEVTPLYSKGTGLDSVIGMADRLSAQAVATIGASMPGAPPAKALAPAAGAATPAPVVTTTPAPAAAPEAGMPVAGGNIIKAEEESGKDDFIKSAKFDGSVLAAAAADLDRDGTKEVFLLKPTSVIVGEIRDGAFRVIKEIKTGTAVKNVSITAVDSDKDGVVEVYVSGIRGERTSSYAIENVEGKYRVTLSGIDWFLRAVKDGAATTLIGQRFSFTNGLYGEVRELKKEGGRVVDKGPYGVALPGTADLYRFALFNFNSRVPDEVDLVVLDTKGRIRVYREVEGTKGGAWKEYWRTEDEYGGTLNYIEPPEENVYREAYQPVPVEGSFYYADFDGDGRTELVVKSNVPGGFGRIAERPRSFKSGTVASVTWDGEFLTELWRTREVTGYIADFFIDDLDGDGSPEMLMAVTESGGMLSGNPESYVLSFKMSL